jgi:RND family efflux transporter MFP subunit
MTLSTLFLLLATAWPVGAVDDASRKIQVDSVLVTLIEQVDVPAQEAGVLANVAVREGQLVTVGTMLARIEDAEAQLDMKKAELEVEIARRESKNDVKVRFAEKSYEVANAEWKRSVESVEKYRKSVSQSELDRLRLLVEQATLEVEQAKHDLNIAELTGQLKDNARQIALRSTQRRQLTSPLDGMVVQIKRHKGEWVQPGETVLRILRIDRLRAEGFLLAKNVQGDLSGCRATLKVDLPGHPGAEFPGTLTFVSPEVNPVNGQIRVWAEIENRDLLLRPGLQATLTIEPGTAQPRATAAGR